MIKHRLHIQQVNPAQPQIETWEHGEIWRGVQSIVIDLGTAHWYGQGSLGNQHWPLEKLAQYPAPFITSDNGTTGLLTMLHPFWITSDGIGILVEGDDLTTSFNAPLSGEPPAHSFFHPSPLSERPRLASSLETDHALHISGRDLTLRFFLCEDAREVVETFWSITPVSPPPPAHLTENVLWTSWAHFKNDISHDKIIAFAQKIVDYDFPCGHFGIDAKWQMQFGDTHFDPQKFPNPAQTIQTLHALGMQVTVWCVPFYTPQSEHFQPAIDQGYVIRRADGSPYIGQWWEGTAVFLDVTNPAAMQWHLNNLTHLRASAGLDGFKFDAGEGMFYHMPGTTRDDNGSPNRANHQYVDQIAARYPWSDTRSGWFNQSQPMLFRQWDKSSVWGYDNGLASCITQAMTLNLLGYPYHFPDMIGGNQYGDQVVTAELLIRWSQAVAPMPIIQFSIAPWDYGEECAQVCARYARLHRDLARRHAHLIAAQVPIVRPLWWIAPTDEDALTCPDEYLVGDDLLVAPVVMEGARSRDIYLPSGIWQSYWNAQEIHPGAQWLRDYPSPLDTLPLFIKQ